MSNTREYAWCSPEENVIVIQFIMEYCYIAFEWGHEDLYNFGNKHSLFDIDKNPMHCTTWIPLGEV